MLLKSSGDHLPAWISSDINGHRQYQRSSMGINLSTGINGLHSVNLVNVGSLSTCSKIRGSQYASADSAKSW